MNEARFHPRWLGWVVGAMAFLLSGVSVIVAIQCAAREEWISAALVLMPIPFAIWLWRLARQ